MLALFNPNQIRFGEGRGRGLEGRRQGCVIERNGQKALHLRNLLNLYLITYGIYNLQKKLDIELMHKSDDLGEVFDVVLKLES